MSKTSINHRDEVMAAMGIAHGGPEEVLIILPGSTAKYHDVVHSFAFVQSVGGVVTTLLGNPINSESYQTEGLLMTRNKQLHDRVTDEMGLEISQYVRAYNNHFEVNSLSQKAT
ncbi:MAG: hypothetical protein U0525_05525 [Patescibacteria group bacterium]